MSKGLEALERSFGSWEYLKDYETIEKELKALEIIKNKEVDIKWLGSYVSIHNTYEITKEEYNLVKEVLS